MALLNLIKISLGFVSANKIGNNKGEMHREGGMENTRKEID